MTVHTRRLFVTSCFEGKTAHPQNHHRRRQANPKTPIGATSLRGGAATNYNNSTVVGRLRRSKLMALPQTFLERSRLSNRLLRRNTLVQSKLTCTRLAMTVHTRRLPVIRCFKRKTIRLISNFAYDPFLIFIKALVAIYLKYNVPGTYCAALAFTYIRFSGCSDVLW
jgi:hypothetical protein